MVDFEELARVLKEDKKILEESKDLREIQDNDKDNVLAILRDEFF